MHFSSVDEIIIAQVCFVLFFFFVLKHVFRMKTVRGWEKVIRVMSTGRRRLSSNVHVIVRRCASTLPTAGRDDGRSLHTVEKVSLTRKTLCDEATAGSDHDVQPSVGVNARVFARAEVLHAAAFGFHWFYG